MSIICWDGVTLAADRRVTDAARIIGNVRKIEKINGCLVGAAGSLRGAVAMMAWFRDGCDGTLPNLGDEPVEMLVIRPDFGGIWVYEKSFYPYEHRLPQFAIGSGDTVALALMMAGKTAPECVKLVCRVQADCGDGIDTLTFNEAD